MSEIPKGRMPAEHYAELKAAIAKSGADAVILPGGGAEALFEYLTCKHGGKGWKCGKFVCYKHNDELRPVDGEDCARLPAPNNKWSNPIPERVLRKFEEGLTLTAE